MSGDRSGRNVSGRHRIFDTGSQDSRVLRTVGDIRTARQRQRDCRFRMYCRRIQEHHVRVLLADKHPDLGASKNHSFCTLIGQAIDDSQELFFGVHLLPSETQLLVDGVMNDPAVGFAGDQHIDPVLLDQSSFVEALLHRERCAEEAHRLDPRLEENGCRCIGDV